MNQENDIIIHKDLVISKNVEIKRPNLCTYGSPVAIDSFFYCTTGLDIGNYVHISPHVSCIGGKDAKFIAKGFNNIMAGARIICVSDRFDDSGLFGALIPKEFKGKQIKGTVTMEKFSNIGTNAIVMPGSILREGVLLTAGSLLIGDTVPWGVYKGSPAKLEKVLNPFKIKQNYSLLKSKF